VQGTMGGKGKGVIRDTAFRFSGYPKAAKRGTQTAERWKPPPDGWVKLNTDAGFCSESGKASAGVVVRDRRAGFCSLHGEVCGSPEAAEAEACLHGLHPVLEWIRQPTYLESDCLTLTKALVSAPEQRSEMAGIMTECRAAMQLLPKVAIGHVRREANSVARELAKCALKYQSVWLSRKMCRSLYVDIEAEVEAASTRLCNMILVLINEFCLDSQKKNVGKPQAQPQNDSTTILWQPK
jgi:hypothetical protein